MKMRLASSISMGHVFLCDSLEPKKYNINFVRKQCYSIIQSPIIECTNVAKCSIENWSVKKHLETATAITPPFREMFLEWEITKAQMGWYIETTDVGDLNNKRNAVLGLLHSLGANIPKAIDVYSSGDKVDVAEFVDDELNSIKWIVSCDGWGRYPAGLEAGVPKYMGLHIKIIVDENGNRILTLRNASSVTPEDECQTKIDYLFTSKHIICLALQFMNCKNVSQIDVSEEMNPPRKTMQRARIPKLVYKVLQIDPFGSTSNRSHNNGDGESSRSLHICRGHFSTYSDQKPLFGKYAGTFWIPAHVRGSEKHGIVQKDYEIKTGEST